MSTFYRKSSRLLSSFSRRSLLGDLYITDTFQEFYSQDEEEIEFTIFGYNASRRNSIIYHLIALIFLGFPYILYYLFPVLNILQYKTCILDDATVLLVSDHFGNFSIVYIKTQKFRISAINAGEIRYFYYYYTKYMWVEDKRLFGSIPELEPLLTFNDHLNNKRGLSLTDQKYRYELYGPNIINVEIRQPFQTFIEEIVNPLNLFQALCVIIWIIDHYYIYAGWVVMFTIVSAIIALCQIRKSRKEIFDMVETSRENEVVIVRENIFIQPTRMRCNPKNLVPGDLIVLPPDDYKMPCDAVLLTGQCIVNESVLTGESIPKTKNALPPGQEVYNISEHSQYTLYEGSYVIHSRGYDGKDVLARVLKTGYYTTKGTLVKTILFKEQEGITFNKDVFAFVMIILLAASLGTAYILYIYIARGASVRTTLIRSCDIILCTSPPSLPAAMAVGNVYSQARLEKKGIFCASPHKIKTCGQIDIACFDKSGTLTKGSLEINCIIPSIKSTFKKPLKYMWQFQDDSKLLLAAMSTCHALIIVNNKLIGDPLDLNMFQFTKSTLEEKKNQIMVQPLRSTVTEAIPENYKIEIIRQFFFSASVQCMSVLTQTTSKNYMVVYTKGAPEKVKTICISSSIPPNFQSILAEYTTKGNKVIAVAYKDMPPSFSRNDAANADRKMIESNLTFIGFIALKDTLKSETKPVIRTLEDASILTMMVTGDNVLTAISVAYDCGMVHPDQEIFLLGNKIFKGYVPEIVVEKGATTGNYEKLSSKHTSNDYYFAIDGNTWGVLTNFYYNLLPQLLTRIKIFARFFPDQKTQLILELQSLNYVVSMVGDGANDCKALKSANVGVSFSKAQVSVTAAFTSKVEDISCLVHLIKEGRCAKVTGQATFKYMASYGLLVFSCIALVIQERIVLGNYQYLYNDFIVMTSFQLTFSGIGPAKKLISKKPLDSLVAIQNVMPMFLQLFACAGIQYASLRYLLAQSWYVPLPETISDPETGTWVITVVYPLLTQQIVIMALVCSKGRPYREMLIKNYQFLLCVLICLAFDVYLVICPHEMVAEFMDLECLNKGTPEQNNFRYTLYAFPVITLIVVYTIEYGMAEREWFTKLLVYFMCVADPDCATEATLNEPIGVRSLEGSILVIP